MLRSTLRKLRSVRGRELQLLVPGCGNSELSVRLHRDGFLDVTNIDFNATVIEGMGKSNPFSKLYSSKSYCIAEVSVHVVYILFSPRLTNTTCVALRIAAKYPEMMWVVADACDLRPIFPKPSNFDAVLDKVSIYYFISLFCLYMVLPE